ncbi:hypothetical protein PspMM1_26560 [Pseudoalteromonas sp. MM1]|uniref:hypothetical protein n=1 Tax=Pseudoalteromonas sp. MM1 TaxID=3036714 RepID=UPI002573F118|nr:hypothetical protein [Pseudoalteromonas sp. MM1]BED90188.1 hypothetical protein PspMM1_26560 [Pseudoalteromonas sp. MM1]
MFVLERNEKTGKRDRAQIQREVFDRDWRDGAYQLSSIFEQFKELGYGSISFVGVEYIDPLPILSLNHLLFKLIDNKCSIELSLPDLSKSQSYGINSFGNYLVSEGILEFFIETCEKATDGELFLTVKNRKVSIEEYIQNIKKVLYTTSYKFKPYTHLIKPIKYESLGTEVHENVLENIDAIIDRFVSNILSRAIHSEVPSEFQPMVTYKLRTALRESLHNSIEHGFSLPNSENDSSIPNNGLVSFYIRYRNGLVGSDTESRERIEREAEREDLEGNAPLPKLCKKIILDNPGFFELFVLDNGQGVVNSLCYGKERKTLNSVMYDTFHDGASRKVIRKNKNGGMNLIAQLASNNRDFVRVIDRGEWWGSYLPLNSPAWKTKTAEQNVFINENDARALGYAVHYRYTWTDKNQFINELNKNWSALAANVNINSVYQDEHSKITKDIYSYLDYRTTFKRESILENAVKSYLLLSSSLDRSSIIKLVKSAISILPKSTKEIVISDIATHEHIFYQEAVNQLKIKSSVTQITLVTNSLHTISFSADTDGIFTNAKKDIEINDYLRRLRIIDSIFLNEYVNSHPNDCLMINDKIKWSEFKTIVGFLNFSDVFSKKECDLVLRASLMRFAYGFKKNITFIPMDSLVESLDLNVSNEDSFNSQDKSIKINLGSVLVSGKTAKIKSKSKGDEAIYFFIHPSSGQNKPHLFTWEWSVTSQDENVSFYRIGNTPHIARHGWKSFIVPRYTEDGENVYVQNSAKQYLELQNYARPIAKLGHWKYGSNHDFIGLNLIKSFDFGSDHIGFNHDSNLATYFCYTIFKLFKLTLRDLNEDGKSVFRKGKESEGFNDHLIKIPVGNSPILVYPQHSNTQYMINYVLNLIDSLELVAHLQKFIFPVVKTKKNINNSAFQLSGITHERFISLHDTLDSSKITAVIFDDAIITSRTYNNIKYALRGVGINRILPFWLVNRSRLSQSRNLKKSTTFTRLDIPILGQKDSCSFCKVLAVAERIKNYISVPEFVARVEDWLSSWSVKDIQKEWGDAEIEPLFVELTENIQRFSIDPVTGEQLGKCPENNSIKITNTLGLISWITELHSITGREDLALKVISEETLTDKVKIQLLTSQLFYFYGEFESYTSIKYAVALLESCHSLNREDEYTSLSVLCLLLLSKDELFEVLSQWLKTINNGQIFSWATRDLKILLAYANRLGFNPSEWSYANELNRAVSSLYRPENLMSWLWRFHNESMDERGKHHTSIIAQIVNQPVTYKNLIDELDISLSFLDCFLRERIIESLVIDREKYIEISKEAEKLLIKCTQLHHLQSKVLKSRSFGQRPKIGELVCFLGELQTKLFELHKVCFVKIPLDSKMLFEKGLLNTTRDYFKQTFSDMKGSFGQEIKFQQAINKSNLTQVDKWCISNEYQELYCYYDVNVLFILKAIFGNITKHARGKLLCVNEYLNKDDFELSDPKLDEVHFLCEHKIIPEDGTYQISVVNAVSDVESATSDKSKFQRTLSTIRDIGGEAFIECDSKCFNVIIKLRLVHGLEGI